jgi:peptide-methionine (S)-S-oxide reductase
VIRTRVGYAGGTKKNPAYHNLGDHTETIQIDYDPTKISYETLLETFWDSHNPTQRPWSRQYMSIIFFHNEEQRRLATETRDREAIKRKGKIFTEIVPAGQFYPAEAYHQKYSLRREPDLMKEFNEMYPNDNDFMNSTAAARLNGYLDGYGTLEALQTELDSYGLSPGASERLLSIAKRRDLTPGCKP